ncbi:hypothetical protein ACTOB_004632 [Actinoplanes oblitus]|uniref:Uncharacterized protein n=1 Tax=Actinoplanes oblitus TaxID=3040509 RepID=A0ABY8W496_9ACTN|nr:hypothetical protein [Actinoplanes oblitus]WIM92679.1 hypothetical protein ACTOB_004632 [Actinoplanes oblitus]
MSDHWGGFDHHDDLPDLADTHDVPQAHDLPDLSDIAEHHEDDVPAWEHHDPVLDHDDLPDTPDTHDVTADDFPPALDVGDLPEPVDGFPWVDAATLGTPGAYQPDVDPVDPHELAASAGVEIPEGTDPWTALAASDDPAVSALARWWTPDEQ